jgi:hypothetical protein
VEDKMYQITKSTHGQPGISIKDPTNKERASARCLVRASYLDDPDYHLRTRVGAFLQCDYPDWILIEFWNGTAADHQAFATRLAALAESPEID